MPFSPAEADAPGVADGVLRAAPVPADERVGHMIAAARELAAEAGGPTFTVQQVVERSGTSLKSFYRHFASKDDLLVALFADDNRLGAALLTDRLAGVDDPLERLRCVVVGLFRLVGAGNRLGYTGVIVREHLRLAETHPVQLRRAVAPLVDLLEAEVRGAASQGAVHVPDPRRAAVMVFHTVTAHIHALVLGHLDDAVDPVAEQVWSFCQHGLRGHP